MPHLVEKQQQQQQQQGVCSATVTPIDRSVLQAPYL
jgi:hypothetical protein